MKKKSVKGIAALFICLGGVPSQTTARAGRIVRAGSATAKPLFLCILCLTTIWRLPLVSQEPTRPEMTPGLSRSRYSLVTPTIAKARVADTEKGAEAYAADLTDFVVSDRPGKSYVKKFSRRLANADLAARRSGQGWVAESAVAQAFNDLMEQAAPSPSQQIKTDVSVVHRLRFSLCNTSPDLSSVTSHQDECLPSEAMFVIALLMWNNGTAGRPLPEPLSQLHQSKATLIFRTSTGPDARLLLSRYLAASSRPQMVSLYDRLAQTIGF